MIKVMIADDQELLRESLKILLSSQEDIEIADWPRMARRCCGSSPSAIRM